VYEVISMVRCWCYSSRYHSSIIPLRRDVCTASNLSPLPQLTSPAHSPPPPPQQQQQQQQQSHQQTYQGVELPKPLTPVERGIRALTFYSRVLPIFANYALLKQRLETNTTINGNKDEVEALWQEAHEWGSTRLAEAIGHLKGFYVKTGEEEE